MLSASQVAPTGLLDEDTSSEQLRGAVQLGGGREGQQTSIKYDILKNTWRVLGTW